MNAVMKRWCRNGGALALFGMLSLPTVLPSPGAGSEQRVSGFVADRGGKALRHVLIEFRDAGGRRIASASTDESGRFEAMLPEGRYTLEAALRGFATLRNHSVDVTARTPSVDLTLELAPIEEEVIVSATLTATALSQLGSSVTVITGEELRDQAAPYLSDALRRAPGAHLSRSGQPGQLTSLFLRGGESDYTKVLIDGVPVNKPGGSFNFADLSGADIDRIEVVRGPQSALFGSDAISGVVQVFTRRGTSEDLGPAPRVSIEGGSFGTLRWSAGVQGSGKRLDYSTSFTRLDTDNDVENGSFNRETAAANIGVRPSANSELRFVFHGEAGRAGVPGPWAFQPPDPEEYYRNKEITGGVTFTYRAANAWTQKFSYGISDSYQFSADPVDSGSFVPSYGGRTAPFESYDFVYRTVNDTQVQRLGYQSDITLPGSHLLTVGGDVQRESGTVGDPQYEPLRATRTNYGGFLQDQWSARNRLFLTAGARLEHNGSFGNFLAPRASAAVLVRRAKGGEIWGVTKLKANFGLGLKEPTLVESFSRSPYFRGNPSLRPEKSTSFDAGIEQQWADGLASIEVNYFENWFRDQIAYAVTNPATYEGTFFNVGRSHARGVESRLVFRPRRNWEFSGSATYLDSKVTAGGIAGDPAFETGRPLFRRPRHSGFFDMRWTPGRWLFDANVVAVGPRPDSDFVGLGISRNPGYGILNLMAGRRITDGSLLFVAWDNVLDKNYMEVLGYPALGLTFRVGLRMH